MCVYVSLSITCMCLCGVCVCVCLCVCVCACVRACVCVHVYAKYSTGNTRGNMNSPTARLQQPLRGPTHPFSAHL